MDLQHAVIDPNEIPEGTDQRRRTKYGPVVDAFLAVGDLAWEITPNGATAKQTAAGLNRQLKALKGDGPVGGRSFARDDRVFLVKG